MAKQGKKRGRESTNKNDNKTDNNTVTLPGTISSDEPPKKQAKWTNRERSLVFCSRGINHRARHLMLDLRTLMAHSKSESKMDRKDKLLVINEICEMKNCTKCIYIEAKKKQDMYMWFSNIPRGPSVKFLIENIHTMSELKMTGNCLKGSRPLLSFDKAFETEAHWKLVKELFIQIFGTPNHHPKSQPFIDHVFTFSIADGRIWFRNYQILEEDGSLAEIGPRFVLNPIKIFDGSFGGAVVYENTSYVSPNEYRRNLKKRVAQKYMAKVQAKQSVRERTPKMPFTRDPTDDVFLTIRPEDATGAAKNTFYRKT